ncbi:MAG: hypothetical protein WA045_12165 [Nitrospira sp.]
MRNIPILYLDSSNRDSSWFGLLIDNSLQLGIDVVALRQQIVELVLPEHEHQVQGDDGNSHRRGENLSV